MDIHEQDLTKQDIEKIRKELTVVLKSDYGPTKSYKIYEYNKVTAKFTVPLHWASNNLSVKINPVFKSTVHINIGNVLATPRQVQVDCTPLCVQELNKEWGGGIINIITGGGKSIQAMMLIAHAKLKTLVVVHTVELMQQWTASINKFLPQARVGRIQGKTFDVNSKDIVIGMLHTISMKAELKKDMFEDFGIVFYDEVQFLSAEVFSKALMKSRARYVFGLSATIERADGMEHVFKHHIGEILYSNVSTALKQYTNINIIYYRNPEAKEKTMYNGSPNIAGMITDLSENVDRTKMICQELLKLDETRNVLVLSERVEHLRSIHRILGDEISGIFVGGMKEPDKAKSKAKRILLATYHIASVGFDHPKLNTLVFATPRSNITQAIGRIYRKIHEVNPMIIDIADTYSVFPYQLKKRKKIYVKNIKASPEDAKETECLFD